MPTRLCMDCYRPASYRGRCSKHNRVNERQIHRAGRLVYNTKRWQVLRSKVLFDQPLCTMDGCEAIATDVHHITPLDKGGAPYSRANLEPLCHPCHSRLTRQGQQVEFP